MAGSVLVDSVPVNKPGTAINEGSEIRLKELPHPYVSRGGLKIEGAVKAFNLSVANRVCLDVGSSTGGFTHYLLLNGAARVYALDVDINQLDWKIRSEERRVGKECGVRMGPYSAA